MKQRRKPQTQTQTNAINVEPEVEPQDAPDADARAKTTPAAEDQTAETPTPVTEPNPPQAPSIPEQFDQFFADLNAQRQGAVSAEERDILGKLGDLAALTQRAYQHAQQATIPPSGQSGDWTFKIVDAKSIPPEFHEVGRPGTLDIAFARAACDAQHKKGRAPIIAGVQVSRRVL